MCYFPALSVPGLAFLHRLVLAFQVVFVEVGACGIRLVCLFLEMTGLHRFVGASFGTQQQINHQVEAAVPGEPLSDVISIRYILGFRKDNAKFFSKLSLNR